jgi:hypothetical protein
MRKFINKFKGLLMVESTYSSQEWDRNTLKTHNHIDIRKKRSDKDIDCLMLSKQG